MAFRAGWRKPILIYSAIEKPFIVYLVVADGGYSYAEGFRIGPSWTPLLIALARKIVV